MGGRPEVPALDDGLDRLDRAIVRVASGMALVFLATLLVRWAVSGDGALLAQASIPFTVGATGVFILVRKRGGAVAHLVIAITVTAAYVVLSGGDAPESFAAGVLCMALAVVILVRRRVLPTVAGVTGVVLVSVLLVRHEDVAMDRHIANAVLTTLMFLFLAWALVWMKGRVRDSHASLVGQIQSRDDLIASISHEIRTPLTTVVGLAAELRDDYDRFTRAEVDEFIDHMFQQGMEMAFIVEDLLTAARDPSTLGLDMRTIDLRAEVDAALRVIASEVPVVDETGVDAPMVAADAHRLRQILRNLLVNASRYGGTRVRVVLGAGPGTWCVEVRDDGEAIPADEQDRVFEAYYRGHRTPGVTGSLGLGLMVSRRLARILGGELAYHHDGSESVFALRLPRAAVSGGMSAAAAAAASIASD
jgi:signal transduction histidine kinase